MPKIVDRNIFYAAVKAELGDVSTITRKQVLEICEKSNIGRPHWLFNDTSLRVSRGVYSIAPKAPLVVDVETTTPTVTDTTMQMIASVTSINPKVQMTSENYVPEKTVGYVPFGHYNDIRSIVKSGKFFPIFITGLSGNGKTMMVEQVHAELGREVVRVNITIETDEDDLLGGFRLVDGKTVWHNGPVVHAMERGATLLLDEVDLGSNKLMCLQPILEGNAIFLKKINKMVHPSKGFNVIATANTKGKGSDDGRFIGTNVLNEAFLERFSITFEQEYPDQKVEKKILKNILSKYGIEDSEFIAKLVSWAEIVRKTFADGACSEIISTRRLVHISEAYVIFGLDKMKAIKLCLNRFDQDTKESFLDLYAKLDETVSPAPTGEPAADGVATAEVAF